MPVSRLRGLSPCSSATVADNRYHKTGIESVCLRTYLKMNVDIGRDSVLWWRCDTLFASVLLMSSRFPMMGPIYSDVSQW